MSTITLNEASKLNPGKNAIKASLLGSKTASTLVKTSQAALKEWPSLDRTKKKAIYAKLGELKKAAKENMGAEIKGVKPEQKTAATEKATQMYASFVAAVKKREKKEEQPSEEEEGKEETVDVSGLEKERDEIKDWLINAEKELYKKIEGMNDDDAYKVAMKMQDEAIQKAAKYNDLIAKIEDAKKSNEAYRVLTEWFEILLEFDADKIVDKIKDKVEDIAGDAGDSKEDTSDADAEAIDDKIDTLLDELDELESDEGQLEMELDDYNDDRIKAIKKYNDDQTDENEQAKKDAIADYNSAKWKIEKQREDLNKQIKEVKAKIKELKATKNESRIIMTYESFLNERHNS